MQKVPKKFQVLVPCLMILSSFPLSAGAKSLPVRTLNEIVISNLKFIANEQIQADNEIFRKGEWPATIESSLVPVLVGVGKPIGKDFEATPFATGSVVNALTSLYLENPEMRSVPEMQVVPELISKAIPSFERYREGALYNFYPPRMWKGVRVHQPADMTLLPFWKGFTNIPQDADTTSIVYTAKMNDARLKGQKFQVPAEALESFPKYLDRNRNSQFYNDLEDRENTGAFMTWQFDENDPKMPRFWFAPPQKGTRIPFNINDVDCVVNANVLRMLAMNQSRDVEGRAQSCDFLNKVMQTDEHHTCGIYYPNSFNLAFAMSQARKAGETCLTKKTTDATVEFILKEQDVDGGFINGKANIWPDKVQATIFAMTALLEFGDLNDTRVINSLWFGMNYLLKNIKTSKNGDLYFQGDTFFTATAIARGLIVWRSLSYTTANGANLLLKMQKHFPQWTYESFQVVR